MFNFFRRATTFFSLSLPSNQGRDWEAKKYSKFVYFSALMSALRYFSYLFYMRMVSWVIDVTARSCAWKATAGNGLINIPDERNPSHNDLIYAEPPHETKTKRNKRIAMWRSCIVFSVPKRIKSWQGILKNTFFMYWNNKHTFGNNFIILQIPSFRIHFERDEKSGQGRRRGRNVVDVNWRRGSKGL